MYTVSTWAMRGLGRWFEALNCLPLASEEAAGATQSHRPTTRSPGEPGRRLIGRHLMRNGSSAASEHRLQVGINAVDFKKLADDIYFAARRLQASNGHADGRPPEARPEAAWTRGVAGDEGHYYKDRARVII